MVLVCTLPELHGIVPITDEETESQKSLRLIHDHPVSEQGFEHRSFSLKKISGLSLMPHKLSFAWVPREDTSLWSEFTVVPCCWGAVSLVIEGLCWLIDLRGKSVLPHYPVSFKGSQEPTQGKPPYEQLSLVRGELVPLDPLVS